MRPRAGPTRLAEQAVTHELYNTPAMLGNQGFKDFFANGSQTFKRFLAENSALYRLVVDRIRTDKDLVQLLARLGLMDPLVGIEGLDNNLKPALRDPPPEIEKSFRAVETKLGELKIVTDREGVRLIVVAIPAKQASALDHR